ncbi:F-box protein [Acorus calamus]|uniref:F-box protein n=1 Tax=Acorus calamus TaxID=4465 RepID=A0AAV9EVR1_ACOCL|nr:F-box protein [Acorus calamus]
MLCGYLQIVLSVEPQQTLAGPVKIPQRGTHCALTAVHGSSDPAFLSDDGVLLSPISAEGEDLDRAEETTRKGRRARRRGAAAAAAGSSDDVVRQLYVLKTHKCLEIEGTVVGVSVRGDGAIRAVVLVDVYLPIEAWSGCWSFPRSGAVAASLFRHLSCNWEERRSVLASNASDKKYICEDVECIWNHPACHVLRCKIHCVGLGFPDKKLFDLYEVFKSLPGIGKVEKMNSTRISPDDTSTGHGIWDVTDDILTNILAALAPKDLLRVSATCHHLRFLASLAMPCMKLKLFPHQQAAVEWMLKREHNAEILAHPLYMDLSTEDGFTFYINVISGEILTGMAPTIRDFRGGMFCDEPGLGKTVTTLSLILKTHGTIAEPPPGVEVVWCTLNSDRKCGYYELSSNEESWDCRQTITHFPGFCTKGTPQGKEENISFFTEMETVGLTCPLVDLNTTFGEDDNGYVKIFQAFGLVRKIDRTTNRWYYPHFLDNMVLDVSALQIALTKPLNLFRMYLSRATLIIVPANLVDHWRTQILKHVKPGQLHVFIWTDNKKPCAHNLAWDYDIVITTFNRLSAEWGPRKRSVLMQIHWLRVVLDEGHTLGSSLCLTNKLQMAISLAATNRWILTGTPTPNTPNSQVSHLQPMLKFLHEEAYAQNQKSWEAGILRPFEAEMEEGRSRLLQLLQRTMISARKADLHTIPSCIKKMTFLQFNEEHARSYNELVVTVRRNILMADWNDPSHVESLLNPKQWKFRGNTIRNVRLSCCVAGHIKVTEAGHDVQETMDILVEQGLDPVSEECKEWCRLPVITPCRHLLCLGCIALDSERKMGYCIEESGDAKPSNEEVTHEVTLPESGIKIHDQSSKMRPEKVIIFSQFLEHIHVIEQQLTGAGIKYAGMYSPMHSNKKMKSLMAFQYDDNCIALLMDGSAALGLDLSFVGHVFLMEPIWDRSANSNSPTIHF